MQRYNNNFTSLCSTLNFYTISRPNSLIFRQNFFEKSSNGKSWVNKYKAYEWGNTRKGYWHIANSPILATAISNNNLRAAGYATLMGHISNGTQNRNRRMPNGTYGGVRGR